MEEHPFTIQYTSGVPSILQEIGGALAISTYQANRLIFLYSDGEKVIQVPKMVLKPMGIAVQDQYLAVGTLHSLEVFQNSAALAANYPENPKKYGSLIVPRASYYTGGLDIHDVQFGTGNTIYAVNTLFSTICKIDHNGSFTPIWKPTFVSRIAPEDRCHLNGLVMLHGKPKLVSCLGATDAPKAWKETIEKGGLLIDVETNEVVIDHLPMPHSPRLVNGKLYVLLSAIGGLLVVDLRTGTEKAYNLNNFVRGMAVVGSYLCIGTSRIRETSNSFQKLPVKNQKNEAGILFFNLQSEKIEGKIVYTNKVDEIYDVAHVPFFDKSFMLTKEDEAHSLSVVVGDNGLWLKPKEKSSTSKTENTNE